MASGILILRLVLGGTMAGHGAQKLFGAFGGNGLKGTAGFFAMIRFRAPALMALLAALCEFGGGAAFAAGFLTPFAALALAVVMLIAIVTVHIKNGFWAGDSGFEFNLLIWAAAVAVAGSSPGRFSVDHALEWDGSLSGWRWTVGVAVASVLLATLILVFGRKPAEAEPAAS